MKRKTKATVISHNQIQEGIYDLRLATELAAEAHAGQFVGIYTGDSSKLLPRPISICEIDGNRLRLVYRVTGQGTGTDRISRLKPGDTVSVLGILGNGYDVAGIVSQYRHPVLMGGGIGIPPMLELARELSEAYEKRNAATGDDRVSSHDDPYGEISAEPSPTITSILGFRDSRMFLADEFVDLSDVYIATEDGSVGTGGNVLDVMNGSPSRWYGRASMKRTSIPVSGEADALRGDYSKDADSGKNGSAGPECDVILACGPMPMLRAIAAYAGEHGIKAYVSLEERMACGVGACLGCITKTKAPDPHTHVRNARICTDGPVFDVDTLDI